jgi:hypothetical protein
MIDSEQIAEVTLAKAPPATLTIPLVEHHFLTFDEDRPGPHEDDRVHEASTSPISFRAILFGEVLVGSAPGQDDGARDRDGDDEAAGRSAGAGTHTAPRSVAFASKSAPRS